MASPSADRQRFLSMFAVSRETEERLATYVALLHRWQIATNLVSARTLSDVWVRHFADSAQLLDLAPTALRWVDIGSGAGFPGVVIAIRLAEFGAGVVHCVESDRRKCAFLREVVRATDAPAHVHAERLGLSGSGDEFGVVDAVTARAFASLGSTCSLAQRWLNRGATGIFPRGRSAASEVEALEPIRGRRIDLFPSIIDAESAIVVVTAETTELARL